MIDDLVANFKDVLANPDNLQKDPHLLYDIIEPDVPRRKSSTDISAFCKNAAPLQGHRGFSTCIGVYLTAIINKSNGTTFDLHFQQYPIPNLLIDRLHPNVLVRLHGNITYGLISGQGILAVSHKAPISSIGIETAPYRRT